MAKKNGTSKKKVVVNRISASARRGQAARKITSKVSEPVSETISAVRSGYYA